MEVYRLENLISRCRLRMFAFIYIDLVLNRKLIDMERITIPIFSSQPLNQWIMLRIRNLCLILLPLSLSHPSYHLCIVSERRFGNYEFSSFRKKKKQHKPRGWSQAVKSSKNNQLNFWCVTNRRRVMCKHKVLFILN